MAGIISAGVGSGIDISSLIDQLVAAEGQPKANRLDQKEAIAQAELSAIGALQGALSSFQGSISALNDPSVFQSRTANNTQNSIFTVGVDSTATPTNYQVEVTQLAQSHKLTTATFSETTAIVGSGKLTFQFGTYDAGGPSFTLNPDKSTKSVTISSANNTLEGIRDEINNAEIGVKASIINNGSGYQLIIASQDTGAKNSLKILVDDDDLTDTNTAGLSQLAFDPLAAVGSGQNLTESLAAQDAKLIVDGINIDHESNTVTGILDGVTLNLKKAEIGTTATVSVSINTGQMSTQVNSFVDSFNALVETINSLASYDQDTEQAGLLFGDSVVRLIENNLRQIITSNVSGLTGGVRSLADIGVTTTSTGSLQVDSSRLNEAISNNLLDIANVFADNGKPTDSQIKFSNGTDLTQAGNYLIAVSQLATQGNYVGSAAANTTITAGVNDTLVLDVDGESATIILTAGSYTATSLAAEVQSRINGVKALSDNGISVKVTESGGTLTIASQSYGSTSIVDVTGGSGQTDLLGGAPTKTDGLNVIGTIGGVTATGSGQFLTGTGNASGLKIQVVGGATGNRGSIAYTQGIAKQIDELLDDYLASDGGLEERTTILNDRIDKINDDRLVLNDRLERYQARLVAQFTALDQLVANLKNTSDFLTQQLANLPGVTGSQKQ